MQPANPFASQQMPAQGTQKPQSDHAISDINDYPDDGFGPDPFSIPFSEGGYNEKEFASSNEPDDDDMPDEFDAIFGGNPDSMFDVKKPTGQTPPAQQSSPAQPQQPTKASNAAAQDALNSFFNI